MSSALRDRVLLAAAPVLAHLERLRDLCNARLAAWDVEPLTLCVATAVCVLLLQWAWARLGRCASRVRKEGVASMAVGAVISVASWIPAARRAIEAEKATTLKQIRDHAVGAANPNAPAFRRTLPETGVARTQVLALLKASKAAIPSAADAAAAPAASNPAKSPRRKSIGGSAAAVTTMAATTAFERKRAFGGIYSHSAEDADEAKFVTDSFGIYASTNALYPGVWPGLRRCETEVVAMVTSMLHGDPATCAGSMTSGGTESILLAIKAYRDQYRERTGNDGTGADRPQLICCHSAHAAFAKACEFFDVELVSVGTTPHDERMDVAAVRAALTRRTMAVVASAPCFPHGVVDPITELGALCAQRGVGLHVDNCFGGFLLSFLNDIGACARAFDFAVAGVTSISCDLHKYGMATKGNSVIVYRSPALRQHQFTAVADWSGGLFASPTLAGSRPGGLISSAWATLVATGADGYRANAAIIARHFDLLRAELTQTPGIQIVGQPDCGMIAFTTCANGTEAAVDIFAVADALAEIGAWEIGRLQNPKALQFPIGLRQNETVVRAFVADLRAALAAVRADPKRFSKGMAAIYGGAVAMPNRGTVRELLLNYVDALYRAE